MKKKLVVALLTGTVTCSLVLTGCAKETSASDQAAADEVAALIDAIYVQERTEDTDAQCAQAKAGWDALTDAQKELVEGENADPDYFGRDTGDASKDDSRNQDDIGENEILVVSFGTSFNDSRVDDIKGIEDAIQEANPGWSVRRAFTAQIIVNHVQARDGEFIDNMDQALERAATNGVKNLVIQPTHLMHAEQRIERHTPSECRELKEEGLYTCFVKNPYAVQRKLTHGIADGQFIRDRVPMTKEEIREVSICKLRLREGAVVYDIGSGTGSIAIEIAGISDSIQVYALEQNREAVSLIERNKKKFELQNITVSESEAPEGLNGLPAATHAFIGGSGGRLKEILARLRLINPEMRVVINAVSMETICEMREIFSESDRIKEEEVVQLQVSRARKAGSHHLMQSENPVWICAFDFCGK